MQLEFNFISNHKNMKNTTQFNLFSFDFFYYSEIFFLLGDGLSFARFGFGEEAEPIAFAFGSHDFGVALGMLLHETEDAQTIFAAVENDADWHFFPQFPQRPRAVRPSGQSRFAG